MVDQTPLLDISTDTSSPKQQSFIGKSFSFIGNKIAPGSIKGSIFELTIVTVGAGSLVMPYSFSESGIILGPLFMALSGYMSYFTGRILAESGQITDRYSYSELASITCSKWMEYLIRLVFLWNNWGGCVIYTILITDLITHGFKIFFPIPG